MLTRTLDSVLASLGASAPHYFLSAKNATIESTVNIIAPENPMIFSQRFFAKPAACENIIDSIIKRNSLSAISSSENNHNFDNDTLRGVSNCR
jgi:hypothetical protein